MINITDKQLSSMNRLNLNSNGKHHNNNSDIYFDEFKSLLYKVVDCKYFFPDEFERNIEFAIKNDIPNTPKIYDKIYINGEFFGYLMEYIHNSQSFRNAIGKKISIENKIKAINDIHQTLRYLHGQNILLGDIHLDNFLITNDAGYLIDLDYIRFKGDEAKFKTCYDVKPNEQSHKITMASAYTDIVKVALTSLSLLLDTDLEKYINPVSHDINLEEIFNNIIIPSNNENLIKYFYKIMNKELEYFDDYLKNDTYFNTQNQAKQR